MTRLVDALKVVLGAAFVGTVLVIVGGFYAWELGALVVWFVHWIATGQVRL